jgi:hypothetical protein
MYVSLRTKQEISGISEIFHRNLQRFSLEVPIHQCLADQSSWQTGGFADRGFHVQAGFHLYPVLQKRYFL